MCTCNIEQFNSIRLITIYGTAHSSVFPFVLDKNLTTFASGFTQTAFFSFYPNHLLQQKQCIAGPKFKNRHSESERVSYEALLRDKGYVLRYTHIGTGDNPSAGCTMFRRRVDDLSGTTLFCWGSGGTDNVDRIQKDLLVTQYTWVNGAECHAPCCIAI